jgi:hypothetical protein
MSEIERGPNRIVASLRNLLDLTLYLGTQAFSLIRPYSERTRQQVREIFYSTSDQVLEKAEETRKAVRLRMAILEIEHHLNRLYPQIGKLTCDLAAQGSLRVLDDADLKAKVDLAAEYRSRLDDLKEDLERHQARSRARKA